MRATQSVGPAVPLRKRRRDMPRAAGRSKVRLAAHSRGRPSAPAQVAYPIGALARVAGVSTRTVRYYEEIRLLRTARRFSGGRRVFDGDALERLRFIGRLKRLGFSLAEIRHLNEVFALNRSTAQMLAVLDGQLERHEAGLDVQLRELLALQADLAAYRRHIRTRLQSLRRQTLKHRMRGRRP
jgi:DNA-binding transcriptional MerR regulator